jgi:glycerol-3-phosphate dehydrogenase (NAD(P)+)
VKLSVLGAGAWGTALAVCVAARHETHLWARDAAQVAAMRSARVNARYLPGIALPASLSIGDDLEAALQHAGDGLVVIATPMAALRSMLESVPERAHVLWLSKGFEPRSGRLGHEIAAQVRPLASIGVLSGPSFAQEVARAQPSALVASSTDAALALQAVTALHSDTLRVYTSADPIGVEVGGAVKNVMAIATGICDGLALGLNARAALVTRALAEMTRLGVALGGRAETFTGLSGLGDLVLTATGDLSRNRQVGLRLARGEALASILADLGHVAEGVVSTPTIVARARSLGVEMPIAEVVLDVLEGRLAPSQAPARLMGRDARAEHDVGVQVPPA